MWNRARTIIGFLFLILFVAPNVAAVPLVENVDVEAFRLFDDFSGRDSATDFGNTLGTYASTGSGFASFMDVAGEKWQFNAATSGTGNYNAVYCGLSGCSPSPANPYTYCADNTETLENAVISFNFNMVTQPTVANEDFYVHLGDGTSSASQTGQAGLGFTFATDFGNNDYDVQIRIVSTVGSQVTGVLLENVPFANVATLEISNLNCNAGSAFFSGSHAGGANALALDSTGSLAEGEVAAFYIFQVGETHNGGRIAIDDVSLTMPGQITDTAGDVIFCADITETGTYPFGYNYKTAGVTAVAVSGSETNNALTFVGEDQVAAKGWTPGTNTIKAYFNVRARSDGETSYFNLALSTVSGTPDVTTFGNGENTQAFADHVRLKMTEGPTYWQGLFSYVSAGGAVTNLGSSFVMHEANLFTNYYVTMDTTPAELSISLTKQNGDELVAERDLPAAFSGDVIYSEWLIGNDVTAADGQTDLLVGSQVSGSFSTCIYDLAGDGAAPVGSAGAADSSPVEPDEQPGEETDPDALGDAPGPDTPIGIVRTQLEEGWGMDFGWILGMATVAILIVIFAGYATGLAGSAAAIVMGVGVLIGVGLAVTLDFLPVWMLVLTAFLVVALFTMVLFGGKEEGSE